MEDGGVAKTGLGLQVAQHVIVRLGTEGGGKSRSKVGVRESGAIVIGTAIRKKRGRPKKYGLDGSSLSRSFTSEVSVKRGRGRSRGGCPAEGLDRSFRAQKVTIHYGRSFRAQTMIIHTGEEIISKLSSLIQPDSHSLALFSATGSVCNVILCELGHAGGISSYELVVATFKHDVCNKLIGVEFTRIYAHAAISDSANPDHERRQPEQIARTTKVDDNFGTPTCALLEPTDKEINITITSKNNDVNPAYMHINEHKIP